MINRRKIRVYAGILGCLILICSLFSPVLAEGTQTKASTSENSHITLGSWKSPYPSDDERLRSKAGDRDSILTDIPDSFRVVSKQGATVLLFDEATTAVAWYDEESGRGFVSCPLDIGEERYASGRNLERIGSLLSLDYENSQGDIRNYDVMANSVANGTYQVEYIKDGVTVRYSIGEKKVTTREDVPQVISRERLDALLEKMEERDAKDLKARYKLYRREVMSEKKQQEVEAEYPSFAKYDLYILKDIDTDMLETIRQLLVKVGYTEDDLQKDNADNGIVVTKEEKETFEATVHVTLENGEMVVSVPCDQLKSPAGYTIRQVRVMEYFGAANTASRGYILVPDGSGALMYLNDFSTLPQELILDVYGEDLAIRNNQMDHPHEAVTAPVFGMKIGDSGFLAVIEKGAAIASVHSLRAGIRDSYNSVYAAFEVCSSDSYTTITDPTSGADIYTRLYPKKPYLEELRVRYMRLPEKQADYNTMAATYRSWLCRKGELTETDTKSELPFLLETVGSIKMDASFLGLISYQKTVPLTTYVQSQQMVEELAQAGVKNIHLRMTGALNDGYLTGVDSSLKAISKLGGRSQLKKLMSWAQNENISVYLNVNTTQVRKTGWFFNKKALLTQHLGNVYAALYPFEYAVRYKNILKKPYYLLAPSRLLNYAQKQVDFLDQIGCAGISVDDLSGKLYSDFSEKHSTEINDTQQIFQETLAVYADSRQLLVETGNAYSYADADMLCNMSLDGSGYKQLNEAVPFVPMVLHGFRDYAGKAMNYAYDEETYLLRCLEYGAFPYYKLLYQNQDQLKKTDAHELYTSDYALYHERAVKNYLRMAQVLKPVLGETITAHERLDNGLCVTTYSNGRRVIVNYANEAQVYEGKRILGRDGMLL